MKAMRTAPFYLLTILKIQGGVLLWMALIFAALKVGDLPGDWNAHAFCGAWGCLPQMQPLVAYHLFWLSILAPAAGVATWFSPRNIATMLGCTCIVLGVVVLAGMLGWQTWSLLPGLLAGEKTYYWQRFAFTVITTIDIPAIEIFITGCGVLVACQLKPRRESAFTQQAAKPAGNASEYSE